MNQPLRIFTLILLLGTISQPVSAQILPDSLTSRRVRVHLDPIDRDVEGYWYAPVVRGTLLELTADSVTLRLHEAASPVTIATTGISQIYLSKGISRSRTALTRGILWGFTWWALRHTQDEDSALLWGGAGFVLGASVGAIFPEEGWKRIFRK
jgi:hypothetical protein